MSNDDGPGRDTPATLALLAAFLAVYVGRMAAVAAGEPWIAGAFVVDPDDLDAVWTWVGAGLAHGNLPHLLLNAGFLATLGAWAEREVGTPRYLAVFLGVTAVTAPLGTLLTTWALGHPAGVVGSSMGLFGVLGMVCTYRARGTMWLFHPRLRGPRWAWLIVALGISVVGLSVDAWVVGHVTVGHGWHLVGGLAGAGAGWWIAREEREGATPGGPAQS